MALLKQSTARSRAILMIDSSDHVTGKTGLTLTITASKDGAAFASITPTVTELATGWYKLALTSSHTDTLGDLALHITSTGADPTDIADQVVLDLPGIAQTGDNYARIGAPAGASVSADIAAMKVDTAAILVDTGTTLDGRIPAALVGGRMDASLGAIAVGVDLSATMKTSVTTAATAATPIAASVTGAVGSVTGAVGSVTGLTASDVGAIKTKTDFLPSATAGAAGGVFIAGANAATSITTALTANITGNLSGSVGSVTGAVGSVTGAVGSVTATVNADIVKVNGTTVNGTGAPGNEWGP